MEHHLLTVCALIFALGAVVHFETVFVAGAAGRSTAKPGVCPRQTLGVGLCAEFCSKDSDCPNDHKCCSNGCGHACMEPFQVKRGRCPLPQGTPLCAEYCYHDGECQGAKKCCRTSCGHACTDPC